MNYFSFRVANMFLSLAMFTYIITNRDDGQRIYRFVCIHENLHIEKRIWLRRFCLLRKDTKDDMRDTDVG